MNGDPKHFTSEQAKEYKEFLAKEKAFLDDRAKRRGIFEAEIRAQKGQIDELCAQFDDALLSLAHKKLNTYTESLLLEMRIILLAGTITECTQVR